MALGYEVAGYQELCRLHERRGDRGFARQARRSRQPSAALDGAQLKNELLDRIAGRPDPSDEALATEIVQRRRS